MKRRSFQICCFMSLLIASASPAQDTTSTAQDSAKNFLLLPNRGAVNDSAAPFKYSSKKIRTIAGVNLLAFGASMTALYSMWYKDYPQTSFHFFDDNREWLQTDKMGHVYSTYTGARMTTELWRSAGLPKKETAWIGAATGIVYQTAIELMDGYSEGWGWSWGDFTSNMMGSALFIGQELKWKEQRITMKFSFHNKNYGAVLLNQRADQLFGISAAQRMLKDYNGQTYWLSANLRSFFKNSSAPKWLNLAVGYGAEGMFGGKENKWKTENGVVYDVTNIKRSRQFFLSPDIDLTRIQTKNKFLKVTLFILNAFKFPAPSLELIDGKVGVNWFHF